MNRKFHRIWVYSVFWIAELCRKLSNWYRWCRMKTENEYRCCQVKLSSGAQPEGLIIFFVMQDNAYLWGRKSRDKINYCFLLEKISQTVLWLNLHKDNNNYVYNFVPAFPLKLTEFNAPNPVSVLDKFQMRWIICSWLLSFKGKKRER